MLKLKFEKFDKDLYDERFTSELNKQAHFKSHGKEFTNIKSADEYEKLAEILQSKPVDNKHIFGYVGDKYDASGTTPYCKYDKDNEIFVSYTYRNGEPLTITCYTKTIRQYNIDKAKHYADEIPEGM